MHIDLNKLAQIGEIIGTVIAIDGIIKQIALKQGNTRLVSICDIVANDLNEILEIIKLLPTVFSKPTQPTTTPTVGQKVD